VAPAASKQQQLALQLHSLRLCLAGALSSSRCWPSWSDRQVVEGALPGPVGSSVPERAPAVVSAALQQQQQCVTT
jgi:hypothetical protein